MLWWVEIVPSFANRLNASKNIFKKIVIFIGREVIRVGSESRPALRCRPISSGSVAKIRAKIRVRWIVVCRYASDTSRRKRIWSFRRIWRTAVALRETRGRRICGGSRATNRKCIRAYFWTPPWSHDWSTHIWSDWALNWSSRSRRG